MVKIKASHLTGTEKSIVKLMELMVDGAWWIKDKSTLKNSEVVLLLMKSLLNDNSL